MNKQMIIAAAVMTALLGWGVTGFAQGLLDQQLGGKPAEATKTAETPKPADKSAPVAVDPQKKVSPESEITSPDAVKKVDDQELINKLTKPADKPDPQQAAAAQMQAMLDRMGQSQHKLADDRDPGDVTQETQRRIIVDLDAMIELAKQMQGSSSGSGSGQSQPQDGQQRTQSNNNQSGGQGGNVANTGEALPGGGQADAATGDMRNHDPANWGSLPPRDRDQVSHGANEEYLPAYKELIDRYYQALAEMGKGKK